MGVNGTIGMTVPERGSIAEWPPITNRKCGLLVERNGERIRLAGADGENWRLASFVHFMRNKRGESPDAHTIVLDYAREVGHAWPPLEIKLGDTITWQVIDCEDSDLPDFNVEMPGMSAA